MESVLGLLVLAFVNVYFAVTISKVRWLNFLVAAAAILVAAAKWAGWV